MKKNVLSFITITLMITYVSHAQIINTIAGNGTYGYSGDGGSAIAAEINRPLGVAVDSKGNIFIPDGTNNRIRKVSTNGIISTVAGNVIQGSNGDGSTAITAELNLPSGVAVDASGNLYIADAANSRIRKVTTNGIISTVAGNGNRSFSGDGGSATSASLYLPNSVAVDTSGNIYIADTYNNRIRKVNNKGIINTIAGNGIAGFSGDYGQATSAELNNPTGILLDASGNLFIADANNNRIRKVISNGTINTVAGGGNYGDGGSATNAKLNNPKGIALDASGNLFIADEANNIIHKIGSNGIINLVAGGGILGLGDGGSATSAKLISPQGVALDASGNLYIADNGNNRIRKVSFNTTPVTISYLAVTVNYKEIKIDWKTAIEQNTSYFIIQHSTDGISFSDIDTVSAIGIGSNNYEYIDKNSSDGYNYYRLKSIDKDGSFSHSKTVSANLIRNNTKLILYPNPANDFINIEGSHIFEVQITNIVGNRLVTKSFTDATKPIIKISSLPRGIYSVIITTADKKSQTIQLIKK